MSGVEFERLVHDAMRAWAAGDDDRAEQIARGLLNRQADEPNARQILGALALKRDRVEEALTHFQIAGQAAPDHPPILNMLGKTHQRAGNLADARIAFARAGALGFAEAWRSLGRLEVEQNNADAAVSAYERAVAAAPRDAAAAAALAHVLEARHELERARSLAETAIALDPGNEVARLTLAQVLLRQQDFAGAREAATPVLQTENATNRALAHGLIGEACDREGRYDEAFSSFTAANQILAVKHAALKSATMSPFHPDTLHRLRRFVETEDVGAWRRPEVQEQAAPVFLVGFPRSGTTLLDQVLSSHSNIVCLEETEIFANGVADLLTSDAALASWHELAASEIRARRRAYFEGVSSALRAPIGSRVFIDKLPLNLLFVPAIARIFPDARIIFALRDPRDVVLSCYQQRFGLNASMVQLLELDGAARYYDLGMSLFTRSRARFGLACHEVRYERLIADLEGEARRLCSFLGLDFEGAMLGFSETARRRHINTPSVRQVVQPLYTRSIGRWRAYSGALTPVLPLLAPWVERFGYGSA